MSKQRREREVRNDAENCHNVALFSAIILQWIINVVELTQGYPLCQLLLAPFLIKICGVIAGDALARIRVLTRLEI